MHALNSLVHVGSQVSGAPLQRASQTWKPVKQVDWQVNAWAGTGFAMTVKTIPRTAMMAKRIPALLYVFKVFIVVLSET